MMAYGGSEVRPASPISRAGAAEKPDTGTRSLSGKCPLLTADKLGKPRTAPYSGLTGSSKRPSRCRSPLVSDVKAYSQRLDSQPLFRREPLSNTTAILLKGKFCKIFQCQRQPVSVRLPKEASVKFVTRAFTLLPRPQTRFKERFDVPAVLNGIRTCGR